MRYLPSGFAFFVALALIACSGGDPAPSVDLYQYPGLEDGARIVIDPDDFALEFRFDVDPRSAAPECRFDDGDWFSCQSPFVLTENSQELAIQEGYVRFEVRATLPEEDPSPADGIDVLVLFDFDFMLDGADEYEPGSAESPFYFPDEYTASCDRSDCELSCHWDAEGADLVEVPCSLDEPFELSFPDESLNSAYLLVEACATSFGGSQADSHCKGPKTYLFYPAPPRFEAIDSGRRHTCGLVEDGSLWCWGENNAGQVGVDSAELRVPVATRVLNRNWEMVSAGHQHTCALNDAGALYCWGDNSANQLGFNPINPRQAEKVDDGPWLTVSAGGSHTCAIADGGDNDGGLFCWGSNARGQLGLPEAPSGATMQAVAIPAGASERWLAVSAGDEHTCAIAQRTGGGRAAYCWGDAGSGRLGNNSSSGTATSPQAVEGDLGTWNTEVISASNEHTCAIASSGSNRRSYCWGSGSRGRLGVANDDPWLTPERVENGNNHVSVDTGLQHSCALHEDGTIYCWGENVWGQLGTGGDRTNIPEAVDVDDVSFDHVTTGEEHSCGIDTRGFVFCWGESDHGRLGLGTDDDGDFIAADTPARIAWPQGEFIPQPGD